MDDVDVAQKYEESARRHGAAITLTPDRATPLVIDGETCCCDCEVVIPEERLAARPDAARCIECQTAHDKHLAQYARGR
jgi:phage/conjugal plasmid C-4 type zinc finger TraR family protein